MDEQALILRWIDTWKQAGTELEAMRLRELRALTDEDVRRIVQELFSAPLPPGLPPRAGCGLVEQQHWFAKQRRRA